MPAPARLNSAWSWRRAVLQLPAPYAAVPRDRDVWPGGVASGVPAATCLESESTGAHAHRSPALLRSPSALLSNHPRPAVFGHGKGIHSPAVPVSGRKSASAQSWPGDDRDSNHPLAAPGGQLPANCFARSTALAQPVHSKARHGSAHCARLIHRHRAEA